MLITCDRCTTVSCPGSTTRGSPLLTSTPIQGPHVTPKFSLETKRSSAFYLLGCQRNDALWYAMVTIGSQSSDAVHAYVTMSKNPSSLNYYVSPLWNWNWKIIWMIGMSPQIICALMRVCGKYEIFSNYENIAEDGIRRKDISDK